MELCAIGLLAGAGYVMARLRAQARPSAPTSGASPGFGIVDVAAGDRPSMRTVHESRHLDEVRADETWRATERSLRALDPSRGRPGVVSRTDRAAPSSASNYVHSPLLGVAVPPERFRHNNMVPFYGGSVKQSTADDAYNGKLEAFTGGFEHRPLGKKKEIDSLFRPTPQGVMSSSGRVIADETRDAYLATMPAPRSRANEAPGGMAPELVGRPGVRGGETGDVYYDMRAYAKQPGVDELRPTSRPKLSFGGRVLPGLAIAPVGIARPAAPAVQPLRYEPLVEELTDIDQLLRTTGASIAAPTRPDDVREIRPTARATTTSPYVGAAGGGAQSRGDAREASLAASRQSMRVGLPGAPVGAAVAASGGARSGDYGKSSVLIYGNNRDVTGARTATGSLVSAVKAMVAPLQDVLRPTRKQDAIDAPRAFGNTGMAVVQPKLTVYDTADVARTTTKQVSAEAASPLGNLRGTPNTTLYHDPDDVARVSRKQTTLGDGAPAMNLAVAARRAVVYDPDDVARVSRKQTTLAEAEAGNLRGGAYAGAVYDPEDYAARVARKQTTLAEAEAGNLRGGAYAGAVYDPDDYAARVSKKQTTLVEAPVGPMRMAAARSAAYDPEGLAPRPTTRQTTVEAGDGGLRNLGGGLAASGSVAYDPDDWRARNTHRQALTDLGTAPEDGNVGALQGTREGGYASAPFEARTTMRQVFEDGSTAFGQASATADRTRGGYVVAPVDIRDTQRQDLVDIEYFGIEATSGPARPTSGESAANMGVHDDRDDAERAFYTHGPTPVGVKLGAGADQLGAYTTTSSAADLLHAVARSRDPSPGRATALPDRLLDAEDGVLVGTMASPRRMFSDGDMLAAGGDRLSLEAGAARAQRASNPVALSRPADL